MISQFLAKTLLFCTLILLCNPASAEQSVQVLPLQQGIRVIIHKPRVSLKAQTSTTFSAWIDSKYSQFPTEKDSPALQKIRVYLAVPAGGDLPVTLNVLHTQYLGNKQLAQSGELSGAPASRSLLLSRPTPVKMSATLRRMGIERGVPVAELEIQPFTYTTDGELSVMDSASIDIGFGAAVPVTSARLAPLDQSSLSHIANQQQIPSIIEQRKNDGRKFNSTLGLQTTDRSWYNPATTYLRIATTTDGVARLRAADILNAAPEWRGLASGGLHLLLKGTEVPIGYAQDDGVIGADDEIYFAGQRAKGDSTWLSCLTDETVYYLYYDNSFTGKRYAAFPEPANPSATISSVPMFRHIEQDHVFHAGDYGLPAEISVFRTDILYNEGFYWSILANDIKANAFTHQFALTPSEINGDSLDVRLVYHTITLNEDEDNKPVLEPNYALMCSLNGQQVQSRSISGIVTDDFRFTLFPQTAPAGLNSVYFKSLPVPNSADGQVRISQVFVDYLEVKGRAKPFAENGKVDWLLEPLPENSRLPMNGMRSDAVVVLDTSNSYLALKKASSGTTVHASALAGASQRASITLNTTVSVNADTAGLFVAVCEAPDFTQVRSRRFSGNSDQVRAFVELSAPGSIIACVMNDSLAVSSSTVLFFKELGSTEIANLAPRTSWSACFRRGSGLIAERRGNGSSNVASVAEFIAHSGGKSFQTDIALSSGMRYVLQAADTSSAEVASVRREPRSTLQDTSEQYDAIIITHPKFAEQSNRLAKHRSAQGWKVAVVSVLDIYKEFYAGEKSPFAIRKFLQFANQKWPKPAPAYLTLMGDASWDPRKNLSGSVNEDYVPSYGSPTSDFWYTLLDGDDYLNEMVVGRLPVNTVEEATAVVDKLIEYDSLPASPWLKNFMFLSAKGFESHVGYVEDFILFPPICGDTLHITSDGGSSVDYTKTTKIRTAINSGALWLAFNGHSSADFFELDGWRVEDLNNISRYNMLATYSCTSGDFAKSDGVCRNESYLTAPRKGSIAVFGNTGLGVTAVDASVFYNMYKTVTFDTIRRLGDILKAAKFGYDREANGQNMMMQHLLLGDPLTRLAFDNKSDLYMMPQEVRVTTALGNESISETDSLAAVMFTMRNAGVNESRDIPILIIHRYEGGTDTARMTTGELCSRVDLFTSFSILNRAGTHTLTFIIDPDVTLNESRINNNSITVSFEVFSAGLASLDPRPYWDVAAKKPVFRFVMPQSITKPEFEFRIEKEGAAGIPIVEVKASEPTAELAISSLYIEWLPALELQVGASYTLLARLKNTESGRVSDWLNVPFYAVNSPGKNTAEWRQKSTSELRGNTMNNIAIVQNNDSTELRLYNYTLPIAAYSCGDGQGKRYGRTVVGQHEYSASVDQTSFSMTHLTPQDTIGRHTDYRTFYNFTPGTASSLIQCDQAVRYLRDSVENGDIIILTSSDACFTGFAFNHPDSIGSGDSLISVLKKFYRSQWIDSVFYGTSYPDGTKFDPVWRHLASWAIIARKGDSTFPTVEAFNSRFDTVEVHDTLPFYAFKGDFSTPTIGPAYAWDSVTVLSDAPPNSSIRTQVYGKSKQSEPEQLLITSDSSRISLAGISAKEYPYLRMKTMLERSRYSAEPTVAGLSCSYTPTVEYAVVPGSARIVPEMVLRGDTSTFDVAVTNIAKRGVADTSSMVVSVEPEQGSGVTLLRTYSLPLILTDETRTYTQPIASNELAPVSRVRTIIDEQSLLNELYRFNNSGSTLYRSYEDTLKPRVELLVDGMRVQDGDYVAPTPRFEILVRDNSQLVIDSGKIRVRINRFVQPDTTTREAEYRQIKGNGDLRVNFTFITRRLEEGENFVQIITEDASANKDTLRMYLNVAKFASISSDLVVPNPTTGNASIRFQYVGLAQDVPATLDIFNVSGQFIRTVTTTARIGANSFEWDGYDRFGDNVPPGVYFYRINVQAENYTDTLFGKIMVAR